jgi:hypothetical protein
LRSDGGNVGHHHGASQEAMGSIQEEIEATIKTGQEHIRVKMKTKQEEIKVTVRANQV